MAAQTTKGKHSHGIPSLTFLADVRPQKVKFLGLGIAFGELNLLDGDPGTNKSSVTLDLAARLSTGRAMPDGTKNDQAGVLLLVAEDSLGKTVRPRLEAAGADLRRIAVLDEGVTLDKLAVIEEATRRIHARLVVIDPIMAFLTRHAHFDQAVRQALKPLKGLADRTGAAFVLVRHLNKSGGRHSLYRGSGSIGIIAAARSALLAANDPKDSNMRVLCHVKNNLGPLIPSLRYEPVKADNGTLVIEWRGQCDYRPEDLLVPPKDTQGRLDEAKKFLLDILEGGPVEQQTVKAKAAEMALAWRTVERAKEFLGIVSQRKGWGPGSKCVWQLPKLEKK
jgi:RecA-family ATPase